MGRVCEVCGKGPGTGYSVSFSHRRTKRRWLPNLHRAQILRDGRLVRLRVCTRCLRTQEKVS